MRARVAASRVLVVGAAKTGIAVVEALVEEGIAVKVVDQNSTPELEQAARTLAALGVETELGVAGTVPLDDFDLVIPSPAVKPSSDILTAARDRQMPILSEPELAYRFTELDIVGITGTNGKTTTTTLIGHILTSVSAEHRVCGNIGYPLVAAAREAPKGAVLVAELSSFQLEYTLVFRPKVGVLLNLTPDHLDWHGDLAHYVDAKLKLFANQLSTDFAVVNWDDPLVRQQIPNLKAQVVPVSHHVQLEGGVFVQNGAIMTDFDGSEEVICHVDDLLVRGHHNVDNAMAATAAALCLGVPADAIGAALRTFVAPEHRLEEIETSDGRIWVNDSKATNPDSTAVALCAYDDPLILLGGRTTETDFSALVEVVATRAKGAILFGEAADVLQDAFRAGGHTATRVGTLEEAVEAARRLSSPGDIILFSPACKSFDEFDNYEERGRAFKRWARGEDMHA